MENTANSIEEAKERKSVIKNSRTNIIFRQILRTLGHNQEIKPKDTWGRRRSCDTH
jgi:hypothetical protein